MSAGPLQLALSPYHMTTAEPSALVAMLLGSRIVTMIPTPFGFAGGEMGRQQVREAVEGSPAYLRLMESWRWSAPLWQAGVVGAVERTEDAGDDIQRIWQRIILPGGGERAAAAHDPLAALRPVMRPTLYRDQREYLDLVCADILKGGPDPGISVVVAAGLDAFSMRHGLIAVRAGPGDRAGPGGGGGMVGIGSACGTPGGSIWQRAESTLCRRLFAVGVPTLLRASGRRILAARSRFQAELDELRAAIAAAVAATGTHAHADVADRITEAAAGYSRAFAAAKGDIATGDDDQGVRIVDGFVSVTGVVMPGDAALRSSLTAVRSLGARGRGTPPVPRAPDSGRRLDGEPDAPLFALVIKRMNIRPEALSKGVGKAAPAPVAEAPRAEAPRRRA